MGIFSSVSVKQGLSNSSTNMTNPIGREECLRLCLQYDNWGGAKKPSPAKLFRLVGPGMVLYQIYKAPDGRHLRRGVVFYSAGGENKANIFEWFDFGDGGCPTFNVRDELLHVSGDVFRTATPFKVYEKADTSAIGELNWNTATGEFAYREIYTTPKGEKSEVVDKIGTENKSKQTPPSHDNGGASIKPQPRKEDVQQNNAKVPRKHGRFCRILCVLIIDTIVGCALWIYKEELPKVFSDTFGSTTSENKPMVLANQKQREEERLQQKASAEQQKRQMVEVAQAAKEAGAETYAVSKWEQGNVARKLGDNKFDAEAYEEAKKFYSEAENHFKMATELAVSNAEVRQQKKRMMDASQAAKEAGAETYAVSEWEQGNVARKLGDNMFDAEAYEEAKKFYSEAENHFKMATELAVSDAEVRQQKKRMMDASQAAKEAGAKEYAVREWNKGVAAWNHGDDMAKAETYELAKEYYSKAENHFNAAELAASKVEAKKILDVLPSLEARAADLIRDNERWFKMSVNASELTSMGDELANAWNKINVLNGPGLGQGFTDKDDIKLKALMEKCYILASDAGDGVAAYKLYRLYGGADKSMPIAINILTNNQNLAESYLDKAAQRNNPDAMKIIALRNYRSMEQASRIAENMNARKCATRIWNDAVGNWDAGNDFFAKGEYLMAIKYYNNAERLFVQARGGNND